MAVMQLLNRAKSGMQVPSQMPQELAVSSGLMQPIMAMQPPSQPQKPEPAQDPYFNAMVHVKNPEP